MSESPSTFSQCELALSLRALKEEDSGKVGENWQEVPRAEDQHLVSQLNSLYMGDAQDWVPKGELKNPVSS